MAITDGGENSSHTTDTKLKKALESKGVRLFAFIFDIESPLGRAPEEREGPVRLRQMADRSAGYLVIADRGTIEKGRPVLEPMIATILKPLKLLLDVPPAAEGKLSVKYRGERSRDMLLLAPARLARMALTADGTASK